MAQSLVKLTLESNQYERGLKNAKKQLDDFTRAIGVNMKSLSGMALTAGAVTTALKVAKDAFNESRQMVDEWGRTMQSAQTLYSGFLNSLNTGDFSGFLNNMSRISQAARDAYDAVSDLQLLNEFNAGNMADARTGLTESIADFRSGSGSKESVLSAAENLKKELKRRQEAEKDAFEKIVTEEATKRGMAAEPLLNTLKGNYDDFVNLMHENLPDSYSKRTVAPTGMFGTFAGVQLGYNLSTRTSKAPGTDAERLSDFARNITPENMKKLQEYNVKYKQTANEIASTDKMVARILGGKTSTGGGGKGGINSSYAADSIAAQEALVAELTRKWKEAGAAVRDDYKTQLEAAKNELQNMLNPLGPQKALTAEDINGVSSVKAGNLTGSLLGPVAGLASDDLPQLLSPLQQINKEIEKTQYLMELSPTTDYYQNLKKHLEELQQKQNEFTGDVDTGGKDAANSFGKAANAIGAASQALNSIQDPSTRIMGIIGQAIATIAQGFANATTTASAGGIYAWIASLAAGGAAMMAAIGTIHSATGYAQGGLVDGKSFSGDNIPIMANAGELVLTKAMQTNLANQLRSRNEPVSSTPYITGELIFLGANNHTRANGQGEIVTTSMLKRMGLM